MNICIDMNKYIWYYMFNKLNIWFINTNKQGGIEK